MKFIELANGVKMPMLGFGTYRLSNPRQCEQAVGSALQAGFRLIDTATAYLNEGAVGKAIKASGIPREEIFITSKLWIDEATAANAGKAIENSLKRLGVDYLDLCLIHEPWGEWHGGWEVLTDFYKKGILRAIGVSNFTPDRLTELMAMHGEKPQVDQIEINPFCQRAAQIAYLRQKGVVPQAWAPLARGKVAENPVLVDIASRLNLGAGQLCLAWLANQKIPALVQTLKPSRMAEDLAALDIELSEEAIQAISALDTGKSCFYEHDDPEIVEKFCARRRPTREELLKACRRSKNF